MNSILYFLGSLGKGVASIIVVFIATFYVKPNELGVYDLVISTLALIQPIILFQINDGIYRWLLEKPEDKNNIIRSGFHVALRNMICANAILIPICLGIGIQNGLLISILLNVNCIYPLFQQITRGLKNHKLFAISGMVNGGFMLAFSYILMSFAGMGIKGFYIAQIVSNIVGVLYLSSSQRIIKGLSDSSKVISTQYNGPMIKYSIMLVPNSINQWVMKALDKYCILFFLSTYDNGIYTVAHRFPDALIMLNNMFYSAWVEQSIVEYKSHDRDSYFSKIYDIYTGLIISVVLLAIPLTKYALIYISGSDYNGSYKYVPFLYIAIIFLGLSSFIGTGYLGTKKTKGIAWTSLAGSIINISVNIFFMPIYGLQVAGISSICAYFIMWVIRLIQTKRFFVIRVKWFKFVLLIIMSFTYAILVQYNNSLFDLVMVSCAFCVAFLVNWPVVKVVKESFLMKISKTHIL